MPDCIVLFKRLLADPPGAAPVRGIDQETVRQYSPGPESSFAVIRRLAWR